VIHSNCKFIFELPETLKFFQIDRKYRCTDYEIFAIISKNSKLLDSKIFDTFSLIFNDILLPDVDISSEIDKVWEHHRIKTKNLIQTDKVDYFPFIWKYDLTFIQELSITLKNFYYILSLQIHLNHLKKLELNSIIIDNNVI